MHESDEVLYADMNARFHDLIIREAHSPMIEQALERNARIPFVGPQTLAFDTTRLDGMYELLLYAHRQHHCIVYTNKQEESTQNETQMREHTNPVKDSLNLS